MTKLRSALLFFFFYKILNDKVDVLKSYPDHDSEFRLSDSVAPVP